LTDILSIAAQFEPDAERAEPFGSGNINDTYLIQARNGEKLILQRINQSVFPTPKLIMANMRAMMEHVARQPAPSVPRWELPNVVPAQDGQDYVIDPQGEFWRAITFIKGARTYPKVKDAQHAGEAGFALGTFQRLISELDVATLHDTLPGFHIMPHYLRQYDERPETPPADDPCIRYGTQVVADRRTWSTILQDACAVGQLRERPIHGDPKIDNIMIDDESGRAVGIIDLDTVKPGLVQYDIGDCLRSSCNPLGEDTLEIDQVTFELDLCESILKGYLTEVKEFYTPEDYGYLYDSVRVLAFEMGLRFFTDYLKGNVYFKIRYPEHNLNRALVQWHLMESIEAQEPQIRTMIRSLSERP
jgi:Ser/Thr protein kinase RdoA (MazF antagonist)